MSLPNAQETLEREFLPIRAKILEIAAALDRLDRGDGSLAHDFRRGQLSRAMQMLLEERSDRAEQVQLIFSLPFDDRWRAAFAAEGWERPEPPQVKPR